MEEKDYSGLNMTAQELRMQLIAQLLSSEKFDYAENIIETAQELERFIVGKN